MGCGSSKIDAGDKLLSQQNAKIERQLREDRKIEARTVKILLLGMLAQFMKRILLLTLGHD
jgi:hypothetical protein